MLFGPSREPPTRGLVERDLGNEADGWRSVFLGTEDTFEVTLCSRFG